MTHTVYSNTNSSEWTLFKERSELTLGSMSNRYLRSSYWLGLETKHPDIHPQIHQLQSMNPEEMPPPSKCAIAFKHIYF